MSVGYTTGSALADTAAPTGPIEERWDERRFTAKLVNPANRRKHRVLVVGTGLAGGSAGATLAEQGYHVVQFCFQDSPRRAHSVAAQGGINAAKNYRNDGDSVRRLFYDTVKGGDFRSRESNVFRLAQISTQIIDQCVAQGVPFARKYGGLGVYLDFRDAITRLGRAAVEEKYGNLFDMYQQITAENPYEVPMRIYPAIHYTMGGLWVDYDLQSNVPGLYVIGEANFSDHGANRRGASALMQGLADGYFVLPSTLADYLARNPLPAVDPAHEAVRQAESEVGDRISRLLSIKGTRTVDSFHRELGTLLWEQCGMARSESGLRKALDRIPQLRAEFWRDAMVPGTGEQFNQELEKANRVADFLEFAELMVLDALQREESCGGHFREESQTPDGEAQRDDEGFSHVSAWEFTGVGADPVLHEEQLEFEYVHPVQRSYA